jgi:hypothetical protein
LWFSFVEEHSVIMAGLAGLLGGYGSEDEGSEDEQQQEQGAQAPTLCPACAQNTWQRK